MTAPVFNGRKAEVTFEWADGEHTFRLYAPLLEELQELCNAGPQFILQRLQSTGDWRFADVRETLRLGLIGGGMDSSVALSLVNRYVGDKKTAAPLLPNVQPAALVLMAALMGVSDDPVGKPQAAKEAGTIPE